MILRDELLRYTNELLNLSAFNDYAPNGLQIEGREEIRSIVSAVSASDVVIQAAIHHKADALLVHHGYFWRNENPVLQGMKRQRIANLLSHDINLLAYHLPLDCHPKLGNNACLAELLNVQSITMHTINKTPNLLWTGSFSKSHSQEELEGLLSELLQRRPLHFGGQGRPIQRLAWCSGAAQDFIEEAKALGADAYLSGEASERTYYQAEELGIHYFACGHHATERYGVQALGEHLANIFDLKHVFIDSANPV